MDLIKDILKQYGQNHLSLPLMLGSDTQLEFFY